MHTNDKIMCRFTNRLADKCKISLDPTSSRWGFISILLTVSLFFVALFPAVFAVHLSYTGGNLMPLTWALVLSIIFGAIGIGLLVFVVGLAKYQKDNPKDMTSNDVRAIRGDTKNILRVVRDDAKNMKTVPKKLDKIIGLLERKSDVSGK